jgi:hypothetical protein
MNLIINSLIITFIISFIIGYSGFVDNFKKRIYELFNGKKIEYKGYSIKPFDCELCLSFWTVLAYNLYSNNTIIISLLIASLMSYFAPILTKLMNYIFIKINDILI